MAERDELLKHNYDGIQEYDNDLPKWWVWLFWATAIFGVFHVAYYHFGPGEFTEEILARDMQELEQIRIQSQPPVQAPEDTEAALLALASNTEALAKGQSVYMTKCLACHGPQGGGLVGPNLTDDFWIHGGSLTQIQELIQKGVAEKGMLAWKGVIPDEEIQAVTIYIRSLRGTNPANPKAPEGSPFTP